MFRRVLTAVVFPALICAAGPVRPVRKPPAPVLARTFAKSTLRFEPNVGQAPLGVRFIARGPGYAMSLGDRDAALALGQDVVHMNLSGAQGASAWTPEDQLPSVTHYYRGSDPKQWHENVPNFGRVKFQDVYAGIDLVYYGKQQRLEYDFVVHPGADPSAIRMSYSGADALRLDPAGDLVLSLHGKELRALKPAIYQEVAGRRVSVEGHYELASGDVRFAVAKYDRSRELVIDPGIAYATYLGGNNLDDAHGIAADSTGAVYVIGTTSSNNFPTLSALQSTFGGPNDVAIVKFDNSEALVYSTYLGPGGGSGNAIAVDSSGAAYVTGRVNATGFPTLNAFQSAYGGSGDAFVSKLSAVGTLVYSTYLGGPATDQGNGIAVDNLGHAFVTGFTGGSFPTQAAAQPAFGGVQDAFVAELSTAGNALVYSTYLGGATQDSGQAIAVDSTGAAYVTGATVGSFPVQNAGQTQFGGAQDAFATKYSPTGGVVYSTYLGGAGTDSGNGIAVDQNGNAYIAGTTTGGFPTLNAAQGTFGGNQDGFLIKLGPTGLGAYSTYTGGTGADAALAVDVDGAGNAFLAGATTSVNFPVLNPFQKTYGGGTFDAFVSEYSPSGALMYSSYLGGAGSEQATGIATDGNGNAYLTGFTTGSFPVFNSFQGTSGGSDDFFIAKVTSASPLTLLSMSPNSASSGGNNITVTLNGTGFYPNVSVLFNGVLVPTTYVSPTKVTFTLASGQLTGAGQVPVSFDNSNVLKFNILAPAVSFMGPTSTPPNQGFDVGLALNGSNFVAGFSTVKFGSTVLQPSFINNTQINATIPASLLVNSGTTFVTVVTGTAVSNSVPFLVGSPDATCNISAGVPPITRYEAAADLLGDMIVTCFGNTNATTDISVTTSTTLTSRILNAATQLTEAMVLVNEPAQAQQVLGTNVFLGTLTNANTITFKGVQLPSDSITLRFVNLRANVHQVQQTAKLVPPVISASVSFRQSAGSTTNVVAGSLLTQVAFVNPASAVQFGAISSAADQRSFQISFIEAFANAFRLRAAAGNNQSTPGTVYNTESGFVNPSLAAPANTAGLANSATRLIAKIKGVPAGVNVYASVFPDTNNNAQLVSADANGAGPTSFIAGSNLFGGKYAQLTIDQNGNGAAVWEVTNVNPFAIETFPFHIVITGMTQSGLGPISVSGGLAPLSTVTTATATDPVPRFAADGLTNFINLTLGSSSTASSSVGTQSLPGYRPSELRRGVRIQSTPQVQVGSNLSLIYNLTNNGPGPAQQTTVSSNLPGTLSYLGCTTSSGGTCAATTNPDGSTNVTGVFSGMFEPGQTPAFTIQALALTASASVSVTTVLSSAATDSEPDDNILVTTFGISATKPPAVTVNFGTSPPGLLLTVTNPATPTQKNPSVLVDQGSTISFTAMTPQADAVVSGKRYAFNSWSDGNTSPAHPAVPPPIGGGSFVGYFDTQYQVSVTTSSPAGGSVSLAPAANGYYNVGSTVQITANPSPGYVLTGFSGDVTTSDGNPVLSYVVPAHASNIRANFLFSQLVLNPGAVFFGATPDHTLITSPQTINVIAPPGANWTVSANQPFISVSPSQGTGSGSFTISMVAAKLPGSGSVSGVVTVTSTGVGNSPQTVNVTANVAPEPLPFGAFDTPIDGATGVAGAIPVTGWVLDSIEVPKVDIWREPVGTEPPGLVYIGDAVFVAGARPDVQALFPSVPLDYRAGWGYLMLTNFLPPSGSNTQSGNGVYKIHAIAHNKAGASLDLGTKTITADNVHATNPFGTIDTPGQGGTASGKTFINFGWALTQNPKCIPTDGSTITVYVDGVPLGHPVYNQNRSDIATLFPGRCNSTGAIGYYFLDTTLMSNGVHTIQWVAFDNAGKGDGLGSRYFNVFNSGTPAAPPDLPVVESTKKVPEEIEVQELDRIEIPLGAVSGYSLVASERAPLPVGSTLKGGVFYWQLGPGFLGRYELVFERPDGTRLHLRVRVQPKTSWGGHDR